YVVLGFLGLPAAARPAVLSLFNFSFIVNVVGRPFANRIGVETGNLPMSQAAGAVGLVLCASGLALLWRKRSIPGIGRAAAPSLMLISYGLISTWQASLFRDTIAAWYAAHAMVFWIGLLGLGYLLAQYSIAKIRDRPAGAESSRWARAAAAWAVCFSAVVIGF